MKSFDDKWRTWVAKNVAEGCSKDILFKVLHDSGIGYAEIREELDHEPAVGLDCIFSPLAAQGEARPPDTILAEQDFEELLEPGPPIDLPEWIREQTLAQHGRVPYLGAGGPACRGFEKRHVDNDIFAEIRARYELAVRDMKEEETDAVGTYLKTVNRTLPPSLLHLDPDFNRILLDLLKPTHEEWCGFELEPAACYGFRVYLPGAYLHEHVDRQDSHVISSTLCVDRQTYAPWPLRAEDADGAFHQIEIDPGETVLYESARIAHGRPVPLNGGFYAALFLHYRPARDWETWLESPSAWWEKQRN